MELPDFEHLMYLAEKNPDELERLRRDYCQQLIDNAPEKLRRKLAGLLFKINMESRRSKNSIHCCIKISQMMMESFGELQAALNSSCATVDKVTVVKNIHANNIIVFPGKNRRIIN